MTEPFDVDNLPITQYLIMEVLAARHRTGEPGWNFPKRARRQLDALATYGLIGYRSWSEPNTYQAWLTEKGKTAVLSEAYEARLQELRERQAS